MFVKESMKQKKHFGIICLFKMHYCVSDVSFSELECKNYIEVIKFSGVIEQKIE